MRVEINPEILEWAIDYSQKDRTEFQIEFPRFNQWLDQSVKPTIKQLQKLAKFSNIPFGYFLLSEKPTLEISQVRDFRTVGGKINDDSRKYSTELRDTIAIAKERQDWLKEYKISQDYPPVNFIGSVNIDMSDDDIVECMKNALGIGENWRTEVKNEDGIFGYLLRKVEDAEVAVFVSSMAGTSFSRKLDVNEFRGFALQDTYAPVIFINGADAPAARTFTLIHELVHLFLGQDGLDNNSEPMCNRIAAKFLVPEKEFLNKWTELDGDFPQLKTFFKVSLIVIYRVALTYGKISNDDYVRLVEIYYQQVGKTQKKGSGGEFYRTLAYRTSTNFSRYLFESVKEGTTLHRDAYHLLGVKGDTFEKAMAKAYERQVQ